jgi:hypothetical protein
MKILFLLIIPFVFIVDVVLLVSSIASLFEGMNFGIDLFPCTRAILRKIKGNSYSAEKDSYDMMETKFSLAEVKKSLITQIGPCWIRAVIYLTVAVLLICFIVVVFAG